MNKTELNQAELEQVTAGSYSFNHDTGKCAIGDEVSASLWKITGDYKTVQTELDKIMDGEGSDAQKNKAMVDLLITNNWGTRLL